MKKIPVFKPSYGAEELRALKKPFADGWLGLGPRTKKFEDEFSAYFGVKYAIGTNSCTAALHLALAVQHIAGAEVITTPMTFVSTNHAILYNKAVPIFCDIEPDTLNIDASKIERLITKKTRAIMIVHYGGHACDMATILNIARRHKLFVVEDAAHGCGGKYKNKWLGSLGDINCFSFHAVKNLATGEGGMITTNDGHWDRELRKMRWMGISKDTWKRTGREGHYDWYYNVDALGYKYHMNDIQGALGSVQLKKLARMNNRRRQIAVHYIQGLSSVAWLETPVQKPYATRSWHNFVIQVNNGQRDQLMTFLKERNISSSVHYFPNHLYDVYKPFRRFLPVAESVWKKIVTLPMFPDLTDREVDTIIEAIHDFDRKIRPSRGV